MRIGGFQKISLIDYPGQISAVVFTQGCNFRCPYCHNPELVDPSLYRDIQDPEAILSFLDLRKGKLDAVTLSGGEPTLQAGLPDFIRRLRKMGYLIKLDTNGAFPDTLKALMNDGGLDYVAMDIKAPPDQYASVTHSHVEAGKIRESMGIIMASGIDYEFRTTVVPSLLTREDLQMIALDIKDARRYVLQRFIPANVLNHEFLRQNSFTLDEMKALKEGLEKSLSHVMIRF